MILEVFDVERIRKAESMIEFIVDNLGDQVCTLIAGCTLPQAVSSS
jgi:hypothetical protein